MMGLDMHFDKVEKVEGYSLEELKAFNQEIIKASDEEALNGLPVNIQELLKRNATSGESLPKLLTQVGYLRQSHTIHEWFVQVVQDGKDDCRQYPVTKEQIDLLIKGLTKSINVTPRYEFVEAKALAESILNQVDFEAEYLLYRSSW